MHDVPKKTINFKKMYFVLLIMPYNLWFVKLFLHKMHKFFFFSKFYKKLLHFEKKCDIIVYWRAVTMLYIHAFNENFFYRLKTFPKI